MITILKSKFSVNIQTVATNFLYNDFVSFKTDHGG